MRVKLNTLYCIRSNHSVAYLYIKIVYISNSIVYPTYICILLIW